MVTETFADVLSQRARGRFVRWDEPLWRATIAGPATELGASLAAAGVPSSDGERVCRAYLELACEAIGLGLLFPASSAGAENFFTLAWTRLIPKQLAAQPIARQPEILAACWNLGENLEASPAWLRRIFLRVCGADGDLGSLAELVADVSRRALAAPTEKLGPRMTPTWVHLGGEDPRFLPGALHFVAPLVVCVHDRLRTGGGGREPATAGVWLGAAQPLPLGAMGCKDIVKATQTIDTPTTATLAANDRRMSEPFAAVRNEWAAAISLETSQYLLTLLPAAAAGA